MKNDKKKSSKTKTAKLDDSELSRASGGALTLNPNLFSAIKITNFYDRFRFNGTKG